ncbi:MAG: alpha/beta hydrolase [Burkholderiaceae bacterium]
MGISTKRFGTSSRQVVGVHQWAGENTPRQARYLLCRPLGQEAVRTAAVFRVLSDRLARDGSESLRFDFHGTGDSPGEEVDQSLEGWVDDALAAHAELSESQETRVNWFGMGLGGTLALRAALRAKSPPANLVLWEPVLDGKTYAQELLDAHRAELAREFGEPWDRLIRTGKVVDPVLPGDVLGFHFGQRLADELQQLHEVSVAPALRRGIRVTCAVHAELRRHFSGLDGDPFFRLHTIESHTDWRSSQAMGTAIVPPDLLRIILSTLE